MTQVSHGGWDACGLMTNGGVKCWGMNSDGRLGDGTTNNQTSPVSVLGLTSSVSKVAYGYGAGCALMNDKTVDCWGYSGWGTLGNASPSGLAITATPVSGLSNATDVVVGGWHVCALISGGSVKCWGINTNGQIGNNSTTQMDTPYTVPGITTATQIAAGQNHTCAVLSGGTVQCWGKNYCGELGDGTTNDQHTPVAVVGLTNVTQVALGTSHTCALLQDSTMKCWGRGDSGQLGNQSFTTTNTAAVTVIGLSGVTSIAAGGDNTCALTSSALKCWGDNQSGAIGSGATVNASSPFNSPQTVVNISTGITSFSIGPSSWGSTVAAVVNGQVYTWGLNDNGQLGNGTTGGNQNEPALTSPF